MRRAALLCASLVLGCGGSDGIPDEQLGDLVIAPRLTPEPIDVARAAKDRSELSRALRLPYREVVAALGPHTYRLASETTVAEGGKRVSALSDQTKIELGDKGAFSAVYTNSGDYGREVISVGGTLYLRPRYQRWHGRDPEPADEPIAIRDSFYAPIAATWDLLGPGAELTDQGSAEVAGRAGRKIAIKLSPERRAMPPETLTQREWREHRSIEALTGEIVLDAEKGVPLSVKLTGSIGFSRDGRHFTMAVSLTAGAAAIGLAVPVTAPAADEVVATPERLREVDDRDFLLQGIAPPLRRNPDGTPVTPQPKLAGSSSVTPQDEQAGSNSQE